MTRRTTVRRLRNAALFLLGTVLLAFAVAWLLSRIRLLGHYIT